MSKTKRPSNKAMEEMFYEIVQFARDQGCPVTVHKDLPKINGSNGYFSSEPTPHLKVALKGKSWPRAVQLLIHEFCHYWQWKDGFLGRKDDEGNIIYSRILEGEQVSPEERKKASSFVRISEYDCEIRTSSLFKKWNLETIFPICDHIRSSNTYNRHIVWSIGDETFPGSGIFYYKYDSLADKLWGNKKFNNFWSPKTEEGQKLLLAPISKKHLEIFDKASGIVRDKDGYPTNADKFRD
jgi:hypothetical protein